MATKCDAMTKAGYPCKKNAIPGELYCRVHKPKDEDERCMSLTKSGEQCKLPRSRGCLVCHIHGGTSNTSNTNNTSDGTSDGTNNNTSGETDPVLLEITRLIVVHETELRRLKSERDRLKKNKKDIKEAQMKFYHHMKGDLSQDQDIKERIISLGLLKKKSDKVPWQIIKSISDSIFDNLNDEDKQMWIDMPKKQKTNKETMEE